MNYSIRSIVTVGAALLLSTTLWADGSGTLDDHTTSLSYTGGPYVVPNVTTQVTSTAGMANICKPGTPTCDVYTLTLNFSDDFLKKNPDATLSINVSWAVLVPNPEDDLPDYDVYFYDSQGNQLASSAGSVSPEQISVPLELLANGVYTVQVIPFAPMGSTFDMNISLTDLGGSKNGILAGGLLPSLMLPFLIAVGLRGSRSTR